MYNKLSFIPAESLYPCKLSIDDFDYEEYTEVEPKQTKAVVKDSNPTYFRLQIEKLLNGLLDEKQMGALLDELKKDHCENFLNFSYFVNLPSDKRLDYDIVFYIFNIIATGDREGLSELPDEVPDGDGFDKVSYNYFMLSLARKIRFGLADENELLESGTTEDYPSIGYFGHYNSNERGIVICPKRIEEAVERLQNKEKVLKGFPKKEEARKVLYAIVIIHLLAQAMLDSTNQLSSDSKSGDPIPCGKLCKKKEGERELYEKIEPESYLLMEKSLANMITLNYFDEYSKKLKNCDYKEVREFISIQPDAYKFGLIQHDSLKPNWRLWRACKNNLKIFCER